MYPLLRIKGFPEIIILILVFFEIRSDMNNEGQVSYTCSKPDNLFKNRSSRMWTEENSCSGGYQNQGTTGKNFGDSKGKLKLLQERIPLITRNLNQDSLKDSVSGRTNSFYGSRRTEGRRSMPIKDLLMWKQNSEKNLFEINSRVHNEKTIADQRRSSHRIPQHLAFRSERFRNSERGDLRNRIREMVRDQDSGLREVKFEKRDRRILDRNPSRVIEDVERAKNNIWRSQESGTKSGVPIYRGIQRISDGHGGRLHRFGNDQRQRQNSKMGNEKENRDYRKESRNEETSRDFSRRNLNSSQFRVNRKQQTRFSISDTRRRENSKISSQRSNSWPIKYTHDPFRSNTPEREVPTNDVSRNNLEEYRYKFRISRAIRFNNKNHRTYEREIPENSLQISRKNIKTRDFNEPNFNIPGSLRSIRNKIISENLERIRNSRIGKKASVRTNNLQVNFGPSREHVLAERTPRPYIFKRFSSEDTVGLRRTSRNEKNFREVASRLSVLRDIYRRNDIIMFDEKVHTERCGSNTRQIMKRMKTSTIGTDTAEFHEYSRSGRSSVENAASYSNLNNENTSRSRNSHQSKRDSMVKTRRSFNRYRPYNQKTFIDHSSNAEADMGRARMDGNSRCVRDSRKNPPSYNNGRLINDGDTYRLTVRHSLQRNEYSAQKSRFYEELIRSRKRVLGNKSTPNRLTREELVNRSSVIRRAVDNAKLDNRREKTFRKLDEGFEKPEPSSDVTRQKRSVRQIREFNYRKTENRRQSRNREYSDIRSSERIERNMEYVRVKQLFDNERRRGTKNVEREFGSAVSSQRHGIRNMHKNTIPHHISEELGVAISRRASIAVLYERKTMNVKYMDRKINEDDDEVPAGSPWFTSIHITLAAIILGQIFFVSGEHEKSRAAFPLNYLRQLKSY